MTTIHKVVLSSIAAICITLIVFYSIKGNNQRPQPVAVVVNAPAPVETPADAQAKAQAEAEARAKAMSQPVLVGPSAVAQGAGLDDLVAKVRSEVGTEPTADASRSVVVLDVVSTNTPAVSTSAPVALSEASSSSAPSEVPSKPADVSSQGSPLITEPVAGDVTKSQPSPVVSDASPPSDVATSNDPAAVPSFTIGEPPRKELAGDADDVNNRHIALAEASRSRELIDGPINELAEITGRREALPPLAQIRDSEGAKANGDGDTKPQPVGAGDAGAVDDATSKEQAGTALIIADPHKPAVKADAASVKVELVAIKPTNEEPEAAANSATSSPAFSTPAKSASPAAASPTTALKTYTVKPGDSFSSIAVSQLGAERHWLAIVDANPGVDPKRIRVGQVINLPDVEEDAKPVVSTAATTTTDNTSKPSETKATSAPDAKIAAKETKPATSSEERIHEVRAGENLTSISRRYYNTPDHWRHLYLTNRELIGSDPGKLKAGVKLKITTPKSE